MRHYANSSMSKQPKKPFASNQQAALRADQSVKTIQFEGRSFELCWKDDHALVYDDTDLADRMATQFGTTATHASNKFEPTHWHTFSIVPLPPT